MNEISLNFGKMEAILAALHNIDSAKRTAFQARLKNFHRLNFPVGFESTRGRATTYNSWTLVQMALALELTQLGLPPERTVNVLSFNWFPTMMAIRMASRELAKNPMGFDAEIQKETDPLSMFLFFDPTALSLLTSSSPEVFGPDFDNALNSFFYGGTGIVIESLVRWTSGPSGGRISLLNVTNLLDRLVKEWCPGLPQRKAVYEDLIYQAGLFGDARGDEAAIDYMFHSLEHSPPQFDPSGQYNDLSEEFAETCDVSVETARASIISFQEQMERRKAYYNDRDS